MTLSINIAVADARWKNAFPRLPAKIRKAARAAFLKAKKPAALRRYGRFEVNILLTGDAALKKLNRDYRGKNKPTNVLSFPQSSPALPATKKTKTAPLGDVALALQTIRRESKDQKKSLESHAIHLVAHGILHLLGYDHMRKKDAKAMEKMECDILKALGYPDPYHEPASKKRRRDGR